MFISSFIDDFNPLLSWASTSTWRHKVPRFFSLILLRFRFVLYSFIIFLGLWWWYIQPINYLIRVKLHLKGLVQLLHTKLLNLLTVVIFLVWVVAEGCCRDDMFQRDWLFRLCLLVFDILQLRFRDCLWQIAKAGVVKTKHACICRPASFWQLKHLKKFSFTFNLNLRIH